MTARLVGGQAEANAAYEEAYEACFKLGVESYRHPIPRISSKTGELKWSMMEMWPMTVSAFQFLSVYVPESLSLPLSISLRAFQCAFVYVTTSLSVCLCLGPCEPFSLPWFKCL